MDSWERNTKNGSEISSTKIYSPQIGKGSIVVCTSTNFSRLNV